MPRAPIPTWFFALVVVRQGDRFLLVHEAKHGQGWCVPAGRVEPGESLFDAAVRETLEETGVPVVLDGVLAPARGHGQGAGRLPGAPAGRRAAQERAR
jgi:phosphatase NudJ